MLARSAPRLPHRAVAALLAVALAASSAPALAVGVNPGSASPVQREQAQAKFLKGRDLYTQKKYAEAVVELRASMDIVQSPNARLYVARALREQGKLVEAYVEFGRTAIEAEELAGQDARYAKTAASAKVERKEIAPKLGFVTLSVEHAGDGSTLVVGGEEVKRAGWTEPVPVAPGTTEVELRTPGKKPLKKSVTLGPGEKTSLTIDAADAPVDESAPAPESKPAGPDAATTGGGGGLRIGGFVAAGVGVVGFALFAGFGLSARSKFNDLQAACTPTCPSSRAGDVDDGRRAQTIANVGLVIGLVGAAASVTLFVLSSKKQSTTQVGVSPQGILVQGVF